jgi:hypothetical protein
MQWTSFLSIHVVDVRVNAVVDAIRIGCDCFHRLGCREDLFYRFLYMTRMNGPHELLHILYTRRWSEQVNPASRAAILYDSAWTPRVWNGYVRSIQARYEDTDDISSAATGTLHLPAPYQTTNHYPFLRLHLCFGPKGIDPCSPRVSELLKE